MLTTLVCIHTFVHNMLHVNYQQVVSKLPFFLSMCQVQVYGIPVAEDLPAHESVVCYM